MRCLLVLRNGALLLALGLGTPAVAQTHLADSVQPLRNANVLHLGSVRSDALQAPWQRFVTLKLVDEPLESALETIARQAGLTLGYASDLLPKGVKVTLRVERRPAEDALDTVLRGTGLQARLLGSGQLTLVQRPEPTTSLSNVRIGAITGRVTDTRTGAGISGAALRIQGTRQGTLSSMDGMYRIEHVPAGRHILVASRIGYAPETRSVSVAADETATVDIQLTVSAVILDQVVVTGTVVPTAVKALPTPVTVITARDIEALKPSNLQQLIRQAVPTAVGWDYAHGPATTPLSVRGATTFSPGSGQLKVYIDGIEVADVTRAAVDPAAIERVEILRGPQAAAIYGSNALGGVVQIFTKRGKAGLQAPEVSAETTLGIIQTPYESPSPVLRPGVALSLRGGEADANYNLGTSYSRTSDWLPGGELSRQSSASVYGGVSYVHGRFGIDISGRHLAQANPVVFNPSLYESGLVSYSKPRYWSAEWQNQSVGARISLASTEWWQHALTIGTDRVTIDLAQSRARLTVPSDTLLLVQNVDRAKTSLTYSSSARGSLGPDADASLTLGFEHYRLPATTWTTFGALNTSGTIQTAAGLPILAGRSRTSNTGVFVQTQLGLRDAVFLTVGARADHNTDFGEAIGTPVSPRVGLTYARSISGVSLKVRQSYGEAIRAPQPGQKLAQVVGAGQILANEELGPERQKGWDGGFDVAFGHHGSLSVTYFDQKADDLIEAVELQPAPDQVRQYQNVGQVRNRGVEFEAALSAGPLRADAQYGYVRARIEQLPTGYRGDLRVGDQSLATPHRTGSLSLAFTPERQGLSLVASLTYVGSWRYYDFVAQAKCIGGTGPCRSSNREFIIDYPGYVKLNARITQRLTPALSAFLTSDNLTNSTAPEVWNHVPVMGRIVTVGARLGSW